MSSKITYFGFNHGKIYITPKKPRNQSALSTLNAIFEYIRHTQPASSEEIQNLRNLVTKIEENYLEKYKLNFFGCLFRWFFGDYKTQVTQTKSQIITLLDSQEKIRQQEALEKEKAKERQKIVKQKVQESSQRRVHEIIAYLDKYKGDPNLYVQEAILTSNVPLLKELIKRGVRLNQPDREGKYLLFYAITCEMRKISINHEGELFDYYLPPDKEIVTLLLQYGANPKKIYSYQGAQTPLEYVEERAKLTQGHRDINFDRPLIYERYRQECNWMETLKTVLKSPPRPVYLAPPPPSLYSKSISTH